MSVLELATTTVWEWPATGGTWRIHHTGGVDAALAGRASQLVESDEARWSRFRPDSELARINAHAGRWVHVSAPTFELLQCAVEWVVRTDSVFQPLVGSALCSWGYRGSLLSEHAFVRVSPTSQAVSGRIELVRDGRRVRIPSAGVLDLGGIAKSWMGMRLADMLASESQDAALLVDAGGDLVAARGEHVVGVERPGPAELNLPGAPVPDSVAHIRLAEGRAVATSGWGRRHWTNGDGVAAHHLIDPATGRPGPLGHATVVAPDLVAADVLAKCLALRPDALASTRLPALVTDAGGSRESAAWREVVAS
jgi:FAD:protein FMN transferase